MKTIEQIAQEAADKCRYSWPSDKRNNYGVILAALTEQKQAHEKELASAREDVKRLDWMEKETNNDMQDPSIIWTDIHICGPYNHGSKVATDWLVEASSDHRSNAFSGPTLREAIDAAMKGAQ